MLSEADSTSEYSLLKSPRASPRILGIMAEKHRRLKMVCILRVCV